MRVSWQACDELASDVVPAADLSFTYWRQSFDVPIDPRAPECHPYRRTANAGAFDDLWIEKTQAVVEKRATLCIITHTDSVGWRG